MDVKIYPRAEQRDRLFAEVNEAVARAADFVGSDLRGLADLLEQLSTALRVKYACSAPIY